MYGDDAAGDPISFTPYEEEWRVLVPCTEASS